MMKRKYIAPQTECLLLVVTTHILAGSGSSKDPSRLNYADSKEHTFYEETNQWESIGKDNYPRYSVWDD
jgi:hypothetical protein